MFTNPSDIQNGWQLRLPADAVVPTPSGGEPVTVEAGDTLTEIATEHHSTEPAVWARNEGRVMSDGRVFSDPNLIKPGEFRIVGQSTPREVLLAAFMFSMEFRNFSHRLFGSTPVRAEIDAVMDFYRGLLARLPKPVGRGRMERADVLLLRGHD